MTQSVTGIELTPASARVDAGTDVQLTVKLQGSISPTNENVVVAPDAAVFSIAIMSSNDAPIQSARTWVDDAAVLHVADDLPSGALITVTAKSAYINPSGSTSIYTDSSAFTVA